MKSPYSAAQLKQREEQLYAKRAELVGRVQHSGHEALTETERDPSGDNPADFGTDAYQQSFTLELLQGDVEKVRQIDEALARIRQGTYGLCTACGAVIPEARLNFFPQTPVCVKCAD